MLLTLLLLTCSGAGKAVALRSAHHGGSKQNGRWREGAAVGAAASVAAQRGRDAPPRALQPLAVAAWSGLNAKDFGAKGDGSTDDAAALQAAIDAALKQQHQLLVPAGIYIVNRQLNVSHSTCANANLGCTMGLIMRGESHHLTEIRAGVKMHAVLNFTCLSGPTGPGGPTPTEGQHIADISIYGQMKADYAIFAPGILYSRFERVFAGTSIKAGMSFGYGWINYVEDVSVFCCVLLVCRPLLPCTLRFYYACRVMPRYDEHGPPCLSLGPPAPRLCFLSFAFAALLR